MKYENYINYEWYLKKSQTYEYKKEDYELYNKFLIDLDDSKIKPS